MQEKYTESEVESKFLELDENTFSKTILVPLFQSIYKQNCKVQFVGGTSEKGKDVTIERTNEFLKKELTVIQTKKVKWSSNSSTNSFQTLLTQLQQALIEPIIDIDTSNEIYANSFIAITPYFIESSVLDHHRNSYRQSIQGKNIDFFDGKKIYDLIIHHNPNIFDSLFGNKDLIKNEIYRKLNHPELMNALGLNNLKSLKEIYCTSEILIGGKHYSEILDNKISSPSKVTINIDKSEIANFVKIRGLLLDNFKIDISNERDIERISNTDSQISEYNSLYGELRVKIRKFSENSFKNSKHKEIADLLDIYEAEKDINRLIFTIKKASEDKEFPSHLSQHLKDIDKTLAPIQAAKEKLENNSISIPINSGLITSEIEKRKSYLITLNPVEIKDIKEYLSILEDVSNLIKPISYFYKSLIVSKSKNPVLTQKLFINKVFDTKMNIAVLGSAGSGKTTNLKSYARRLIDSQFNKFTYFSTLSDLGKICQKHSSTNLVDGIFEDLNSISSHITRKDITKELESGESTLILDSIDEAISEYPWIIESILDIKELYPELQLVTSSRFSIDEINKIPFAHISLLPFNKEQKEEFFSKWFHDNPEGAKEIISHINNNESINHIVDNPLSATILCTLKENGINLPNSEIQLYSERFNLLSGKFDLAKGIRRLCNSPDLILSTAQYCALEIHKLGKRSIPESDFIKLIQKCVGHKKSKDLFQDLLKSEIIERTPRSISFGHLKFQEYLASKEILSNRSFPLSTLFKSPWWHETMKLCAKGSRDLNWLLDYAIMNDLAQNNKQLLISIIEESEIEDKESCISRIRTSDLFDHDFSSELEDDPF